ncbi:TetR/AcrR family transcriptional regulator [Nocardia implantans]|uniref:TetR/AcrR family transcriptional regulator n=1 Tax=Nocardia implantans TaxID=3108168 RepID=A0ABU6AUV1_9NOCA|nr:MULTISPECIES: TetR/AcrR family transcriptional regulator [unclassified Nocardia]MBF6192580.1 helix-turn-helix transcriptional regulator [Nocardia beijingensis]MEA3527513.1 TetR/AcrR family transcriptional regulator [Nocardia sp. CDC192]MEB3511221.1 TetR/AcrR family transcriptional regulator [Nocardia sp. CDC186]
MKSARSGSAEPGPERVVRRRPRNRRAQIAATSAAAFGALGYHGVSMEEIAAKVGISSAALYRHYPSKYSLFRAELLRLGQVTVDAVILPAQAESWSAEARLRYVIDALIAQAVTNRPTVTLARWEGRYLDDEDGKTLTDQFATSIAALRRLIGAVRPGLSKRDEFVRAVAILSIVSSIGDHHAALPTKSLSALLASACWTAVHAALPAFAEVSTEPRPTDPPTPFKHQLLLVKAVQLFHERGYPNVSVEDIAAAADLTAASAVYRYYRSKSDLLTAAFRRAADRVADAIGPAIASSATPFEALTELITLYVAGSFAERELTFVYYTEFSHVPAEDRVVLRNIQRLSVAEWGRLLVAVRPELSEAQARILVHAAFGLVVDLGRALGDGSRGCPEDAVARLMQVTLFDTAIQPPGVRK